MFLWAANFQGLTVSFAHLSTLSRTFIARYICLTKNTGFFTRGGIYPFLLYPTHVFFILFFFYAIVRLILDVVPFYRAHHRTLNTASIYHVLTTYHRTLKQCRSLPCTHTHVMRCPVHMQCKMSLHVISCHMHNECYMDNTIHTTYQCHGQSHHLHMTSINHSIHINLSCKHISTFTFNMSFYDQTMTHTSKPCNGHCT